MSHSADCPTPAVLLWQFEVRHVPLATLSLAAAAPREYVTAATRFVLPLMCVVAVTAAWQSVHGAVGNLKCSWCALLTIAVRSWWHTVQLAAVVFHVGSNACAVPVPSL